MWRQVLFWVCTVEAGLLATGLYLVVIEPDFVLAPRTRQLCAVATLVLASGCCYAVVRQVRAVVTNADLLHR